MNKKFTVQSVGSCFFLYENDALQNTLSWHIADFYFTRFVFSFRITKL